MTFLISTPKSWRDIAISLAGIMQAVDLVDKLARTGFISTADLETCVKTLFVRNPENTESVYGSVAHILRGLENLQTLLDDHRNPQHNNVLRYYLAILHLQKKLASNSKMLETLSKRLDKAQTQFDMFGPTHDNLLANIAEIYSNTISTFNFRIQVTGEPQHLQQSRVANQIRTLLLCAIRSATLWRQIGGRRWHLLFYRKAINAELRLLIDEGKRNLLRR